MPIREYGCTNSECPNYKGFEKLHLEVPEVSLTHCEMCGAELIRYMSASTPIFRGSGFYSTDYKKSKKETKEVNGTTGGNSSHKEKDKT